MKVYAVWDVVPYEGRCLEGLFLKQSSAQAHREKLIEEMGEFFSTYEVREETVDEG